MTFHVNTIDSSRHAMRSSDARRVTVSVRSVRPVLGYLAARGHDAVAVLRETMAHPLDADDTEARIPHPAAVAVWQAAERISADPHIGLHAAERIHPGMFGALEYAVQTSATLGEGLTRLARYHRVLHDVADVRFELQGHVAVLSHRLPLSGGAPRQISEFVVAAWFIGLRRALADWTPLQVRFPHAAPTDTCEHRRVFFGAPLVFGHHRSELHLPLALLDRPLPAADAAVQRAVEAQVQESLAQRATVQTHAARVRALLACTLNAGNITLESAAAQLNLSPRTLHRRLEGEGTSFRRLVHAVRRELAERHLLEGRMMIAEIAFLLGYSEASAFHRAFKQWTGLSPQAFRSRHLQNRSSPMAGITTSRT